MVCSQGLPPWNVTSQTLLGSHILRVSAHPSSCFFPLPATFKLSTLCQVSFFYLLTLADLFISSPLSHPTVYLQIFAGHIMGAENPRDERLLKKQQNFPSNSKGSLLTVFVPSVWTRVPGLPHRVPRSKVREPDSWFIECLKPSLSRGRKDSLPLWGGTNVPPLLSANSEALMSESQDTG